MATVFATDGAPLPLPFPVGAVFLGVVDTNPATLLGYGGWTQVAQGQLLAGFKTGDSSFGTVQGTGGAKTATLTTNELPAHTHGVTDPTHNHTQNSHTHAVGNVGKLATGGTSNLTGSADASSTTATADAATATNIAAATGITINSAGSGAAFSILPPYFVVYIWRRDS